MRLSNKSTFSLACLVLLFAFATAPVMADSMSAVWSADVNRPEGDLSALGGMLRLRWLRHLVLKINLRSARD